MASAVPVSPVIFVGAGGVCILELETRFRVGDDNHGREHAYDDEVTQLFPDQDALPNRELVQGLQH